MKRHPVGRERFLVVWARLATSHPWLVLLCGLILAALSIFYTLGNLQFRSDRSDLIDSSLAWQRRYAQYKAQFPHWDDAVVVIDRGTAPDASVADAFVDALEARLSEESGVGRVDGGFDRAAAPISLILTQPTERIEHIVGELLRASPVLSSRSPGELLSLTGLGGVNLARLHHDDLKALLARSLRIAQGSDEPVLGVGLLGGRERYRSDSGRLGFVFVALGADEDGSINSKSRSIASVRSAIEATRRSDGRFAAIEAGVTGVPVLESDETDQSTRDATLASVVSLTLIGLLLVLHYRGVVAPLLAIGSLLIGVSWSFGWVTLAVGHLQVLSVVFAIVLLGLGIDTAIHLLARLELVHPDHDHMGGAVEQAYRGVGLGIVTGCLTTAAAFGATALTSFAGVAEMGLIAAGGIVLCTIAVMTLLPAMLMLLPRPERRIRARAGGESKSSMGGFGRMLSRHPARLATVGAVLFVLAVWAATGVRYDPNLLNLMPPDAESVVWEQRVTADDAGSAWHAVVLARDADEARTLASRLRSLEVVGEVAGAAMFFPEPDELDARRQLLQSLPVAPGPGEPIDVAAATERLRTSLSALAGVWAEADAELSTIAASLGESCTDEQLANVIEKYVAEREALVLMVNALRSAQLAGPDALPARLAPRFVGADGSLLLRIYPKAARRGLSVLSPEHLTPFASAVLTAAPRATGSAIQIYESTRLIRSAYERAMVYAAIAIFVLLLIDLRSVRDTIAAMMPVVMGAAFMLAIMRLAEIPLNFANTIVMPLILGLGVDAGVHAVHRWRSQPYDIPSGLAGGTGRAITLTSATTIIGFLCMTLAEHRGIRSLGLVMSIGLLMVWVSVSIFLPAVLRLRTLAMVRHELLRQKSSGRDNADRSGGRSAA